MSNEQFSSSEFSQPAISGMPDFEVTPRSNETAHNTIVPIEVFRARQAIAAAVATAPSGSLEVNKVQPTIEKMTPQKAIAKVTFNIITLRKDLDAETIGLYDDDEVIANEILGQPAEILPTDTQDNFDVAA